MKKGLLALLLAVTLAAPVFAVEKGSMEIVPKVGYVIEPLLMEDYYGDYCGYKQESTFSLGADFYYYVMNNLGAGVGVNYVFDSKFKEDWDKQDSLGATNIYVAVKPVFELQENKFIDKIYFLGQLGYCMTRYENKEYFFSSKKYNENGLYWAIGAGVEKCNIVVELVYSVNYFEIEDWNESFTNRRTAINAGYKFSI
ncbi:outer membrane beta-barrel protein [Candidatus Ruminimicrobiellum ovillum]|uniref:outer membrane beta-barrel protein n=1 Tax=Candidatus Ruminimicrobiellum ovillum TaxID=1947927 RepID=UPI003559961E